VLTLTVLDNLLAAALPLQFWWDCDRKPPAEAGHVLKTLQQQGVQQRFQSDGNLGDRMASALSGALNNHTAAMIVGSDCPSVDAAYVLLAAEKLAQVDVVLGPSEDGGYVLIGVRKVVPGMLDGITWGSEHVLRQTCERLANKGLSFGLLPMRWDVDEAEDWQRFQRDFGR
jgi:rSAM/selenodomain-associated transferase 1